jgi:DNA-binding transcriptional MerR regulator
MSRWPIEGVPIGTLTRMAGISHHQVRRWEKSGWLTSELTDPTTGHRRYSEEDMLRARLLGALVTCGMPVERAGEAVARQDRAAIVEHLETARAAMSTAEQLLPAERAGWVRELRMFEERVIEVELEAVTPTEQQLQDELGRLQAAAAAARGIAVAGLPTASRPDGLPTGPAVAVGRPDTEEPAAPCLQLPWDRAEPPTGARVAAAYGGMALSCRVDEGEGVTVDDAHRLLTQELVRGRWLEVFSRRHLHDLGLVCRCVVAYVLR